MGQFFKAVKAILTLLFRKSSASGCGDYYGYPTQVVSTDSPSGMQDLASAMAYVEGQLIASKSSQKTEESGHA